MGLLIYVLMYESCMHECLVHPDPGLSRKVRHVPSQLHAHPGAMLQAGRVLLRLAAALRLEHTEPGLDRQSPGDEWISLGGQRRGGEPGDEGNSLGRQGRGGEPGDEGNSSLDQPAQSALQTKTLNPDWCTLFISSHPVTCSLACARSTQGAKSRPDPATSPPGPARPPRVVYGHHSQEQTRFNNALAGFLGVPVKLPLLAPLAMTLDLKRLFVEVRERQGGMRQKGHRQPRSRRTGRVRAVQVEEGWREQGGEDYTGARWGGARQDGAALVHRPFF